MRPATPDPPDEGEELMSRFIAEAGDPHVEPPVEHVARLRSLLLARLDSSADAPQQSTNAVGWAVPTGASNELVGTAHPTDDSLRGFPGEKPATRSVWRPRARLLVGSGLAAVALSSSSC